MGLNEVFEPTRRHILVLKPIPSIEDVFNMVTQDERQKSIKPSTPLGNVAFQNTGPLANDGHYAGPDDNAAYAASYNRSQRPVCTHCRRSGHTVQKCYKLNGYPPGHKFSRSLMHRRHRDLVHRRHRDLDLLILPWLRHLMQ